MQRLIDELPVTVPEVALPNVGHISMLVDPEAGTSALREHLHRATASSTL